MKCTCGSSWECVCPTCHQWAPSDEWISVKNEPPRKDIPILVWTEYLDFPVSVYWKERGTYGKPGYFENGDEYEMKEESITHWLPLQEPPK